ncbi:MAG: cation diffusion facilitator family transporter [Curvibacter sp.]|jgi:cation diffusion facilitator family transporter|nr:cation transporter [Curvibacter sp.]
MVRTKEEQRQALRSTWVSVWVNLFLATAQVVIGVFSRSQALVADGLHSLSDLVADAVVLVAARHSHAEADDTHPYGHARFETAAALAIGLILLATGLGMVWSAGLRLHEGSADAAVHPLALLAAIITLLAKEGLFHYMRRIGERLKSAMLIANAWHARADAASSLVVAVGVAANLLGWHSMDAVAAIIVGVMIVKSGWSFSLEAFHSLTDHALDPEEIERIRQTIVAVDGVDEVHNLRTRRMGDWAVIDMHVEVDPRLSVSEGHYIAEQITARVRAAHRVDECTVHVDPGHVRHLPRLLALPPRPQVLACAREVLGHEPAALQLHYLESGLEVDVLAATVMPAADRAALALALQAALGTLTAQPVRVTLRGHGAD